MACPGLAKTWPGLMSTGGSPQPDVSPCIDLSFLHLTHLEEVLLLEPVVCGALEVELDVLALLERHLHRVYLLHRPRPQGVYQPGRLRSHYLI